MKRPRFTCRTSAEAQDIICGALLDREQWAALMERERRGTLPPVLEAELIRHLFLLSIWLDKEPVGATPDSPLVDACRRLITFSAELLLVAGELLDRADMRDGGAALRELPLDEWRAKVTQGAETIAAMRRVLEENGAHMIAAAGVQ